MAMLQGPPPTKLPQRRGAIDLPEESLRRRPQPLLRMLPRDPARLIKLRKPMHMLMLLAKPGREALALLMSGWMKENTKLDKID